MGKHTPGPWEIRRNKAGYPYSIHAPNGDSGPGGIQDITRWASIGFPSSSEGEANARLIAAAPMLLEALEEAVDDLKTIAEIGPKSVSIELQPYLTAIATAKGEDIGV